MQFVFYKSTKRYPAENVCVKQP